MITTTERRAELETIIATNVAAMAAAAKSEFEIELYVAMARALWPHSRVDVS